MLGAVLLLYFLRRIELSCVIFFSNSNFSQKMVFYWILQPYFLLCALFVVTVYTEEVSVSNKNLKYCYSNIMLGSISSVDQ